MPRSNYPRNWDQIRRQALIRDQGLCQDCLKQGFRMVASEVHHLKPVRFGGTHDLWNLESICVEHHLQKNFSSAIYHYSNKRCKHGHRIILAPRKKKKGYGLNMACKDNECWRESGAPDKLKKYRNVQPDFTKKIPTELR